MLYTFVLSRFRFVLACGLSVLAFDEAFAQQDPKLPIPKLAPFPAPSPVPTKESTFASQPEVLTRYTLGEALSIGHSNHPQISALRASMNAALLKGRGLSEVKRLIGFLSPDIEFREKQSDLGLKAAMAEYDQAQYEVTYAVIRCYFTVVYAREQGRVARDLVEQFEANLEQVRKIVEGKGGGIRGISVNNLNTLELFTGAARKKLIEAETGADRARAALREAMGLEPGSRVDAADEVLPEIKASMTRDVVIAHAVTRRGEILLSQIGADVTRLEACAQWAKRFSLMATTFSNAGDIHARPIPGPSREPDYRPGMIGPEMPDRMLGNRATRTETAGQYAIRSQLAAKQARSLLGLEAEIAYTKWVQAVENVKVSRAAAKSGRDLIERLREAAGGAPTKEEAITAEVGSAQAFAAYNEALHDQIVALADLERITAGGVRVNFPGR